jgi:hypothetical protein
LSFSLAQLDPAPNLFRGGNPVAVLDHAQPLVVVPLDPAVGAYARRAPVLRLSREETGGPGEQVAVPWRLRAISADSLAPAPVGRLRPDTLRALDELLKLVLDLR